MTKTKKIMRTLSGLVGSVLALGAISPLALGDVVINEIGNAPSQRLVKWSEEGVPSIGTGLGWFEPGFDDAQWMTGDAPFGWGYSDINTSTAPTMRGKVPSLYLRHRFNVSSSLAGSSRDLVLEVEADDGYVAFLNGREIARCNLGVANTIVYADQLAFNDHPEGNSSETTTIGQISDFLQAGENVLAIQVVNFDLESPLKIEAELRNSNRSETFVEEEADWKIFAGHVEPSGGVFEPAFNNGGSQLFVAWGDPDFNVSSWERGSGPIGFDATSSYDLGTNLKNEMRDITPSVYMRRDFDMSASEVAGTEYLELTIDYDDGYIAYLNGHEIARGTMGVIGSFVSYDSLSAGSHNASDDAGNLTNAPSVIAFNKTHLREGDNTLAIQLHNESIDSSDLIADATLRSMGSSSQTLLSSGVTWDYFIGTEEPSAVPPPTPLTPESDFSDWVELHNTGSSTVNLTGWTLSDDTSDAGKWTFPAGTTIPANGYLLILADDNEELNGSTTYLHAGFKLSQSGESVILVDSAGSLRDIQAGYPPLHDFYSWGSHPQNPNNFVYLATPTPGEPNQGSALAERVDTVDFSVDGGFHAGTVSLLLSTDTPGAAIYYTTDGTEPSETNGTAYTGALSLNRIDSQTGHVIRARAVLPGAIPSRVRTRTYLIGHDAGLQENPALIFTAAPERTIYKPWGVLSKEGGAYDSADAWMSTDKNDYNFPSLRGRPYERPIYAEYYYPDGSEGWREDVGLRYSGSDSARSKIRIDSPGDSPWESSSKQKPSFNLFFRGEYGVTELKHPLISPDYDVSRFDSLRIRAGKNDIDNPFVKDEFLRRMYHEMGQESAIGVFNSLYINGELKGFYNTVERLREDFMQDHYESNLEWDVRQVGDFPSGTPDDWNSTMSLLKTDLNDEATWQEVLSRVDVVNVADYFLLNIYGATWDWPSNNWVASRERSEDGRWRFFVWDAEGSMGHRDRKETDYDTIGIDLLGSTKVLSNVFNRLYESEEWRLIMADRIHKHMFNGGALDDRSSSGTVTQVKNDLIAELQPLVTYVLDETLEEDWHDNWVDTNTGRRAYLFGPRDTMFEDYDLWPDTEPVEFDEQGGSFGSGFALAMDAPAGSIYYTIDGTDPREFGGGISSNSERYTSDVDLPNGLVTVKARALRNGEWSALTEGVFAVGISGPVPGDLVISEFMYHHVDPTPAELANGFLDDADFEFIFVKNISSNPIDLRGVRIDQGIEFSFTGSAITLLAPGESVIIVANKAAFEARYGDSLADQIAGSWVGGLKNSSESIRMVNEVGAVLQNFIYDDGAPWPTSPDGGGYSLVLRNPNSNPDHNLAANWEASATFGGTPGSGITSLSYEEWRNNVFSSADASNNSISGPVADPDADGFNNLLEWALGMSPYSGLLIDAPQFVVITENGNQYAALRFRRLTGVPGLTYTMEESTDLVGWSASDAQLAGVPQANVDGTTTVTYRESTPIGSDQPRYFMRVRVTGP